MSDASIGDCELDRPRFSAPMIDKSAIVPISACVFALIVAPLLLFVTPPDAHTLEARPENRLFWPAIAAISVVLVVQNRSRLARLTLPPHIVSLLAYLAFAGASALWAFNPESSFIRFIQQVMIVTSIVLPAMLAARTADMMRGLFLCFASASILNVPFVLGGSATITTYASMHGPALVNIGYQGYFEGKNYLGECAAIALLLSPHEIRYPGWRRALGIIIVIIAILLVFIERFQNSPLALHLFVHSWLHLH
jgi:exopolysaccharide production protein ExoQ